MYQWILEKGELSPQLKLLSALIYNLSSKEGYCWASNSELGSILGTSESAINSSLGELMKKKFIVNKGNKHNRKLCIAIESCNDCFYISIPNFILANTKLTPAEKIICSLVIQLSYHKGYSFASYDKLAELSGFDKDVTKRHINKLIKNNFLRNNSDKKEIKLVFAEEARLNFHNYLNKEFLDLKQDFLDSKSEKINASSII